MNSVSDYLPKVTRQYTPEEVEASRRAVARRNAVCDPDCPECAGVGYISQGEGKVGICSQYLPRLIAATPGRYGMTSTELSLSWKSLLPLDDSIVLGKQVRAWLEGDGGLLYLWGEHGRAKTLVLKIAVACMLAGGHEAAYTTMAGLLEHLRAAFDQTNPSDTSAARLAWWSSLPLLAVDEFNRASETAWVTERRFLLMDARYVQAIRGESKTIVASNTAPDAQEGYLADRFLDTRCTVIRVTGKSVRRIIPKEVGY